MAPVWQHPTALPTPPTPSVAVGTSGRLSVLRLIHATAPESLASVLNHRSASRQNSAFGQSQHRDQPRGRHGIRVIEGSWHSPANVRKLHLRDALLLSENVLQMGPISPDQIGVLGLTCRLPNDHDRWIEAQTWPGVPARTAMPPVAYRGHRRPRADQSTYGSWMSAMSWFSRFTTMLSGFRVVSQMSSSVWLRLPSMCGTNGGTYTKSPSSIVTISS